MVVHAVGIGILEDGHDLWDSHLLGWRVFGVTTSATAAEAHDADGDERTSPSRELASMLSVHLSDPQRVFGRSALWTERVANCRPTEARGVPR